MAHGVRGKAGRNSGQMGRGKNHSVNRERSRIERKKSNRAKFNRERNLKAYRKIKLEISKYWKGERDTHPLA